MEVISSSDDIATKNLLFSDIANQDVLCGLDIIEKTTPVPFDYHFMQSKKFLSFLKNRIKKIFGDISSIDMVHGFEVKNGDVRLIIDGQKYNVFSLLIRNEIIYLRWGNSDDDYGKGYPNAVLINLASCKSTYEEIMKDRVDLYQFIASVIAQELSHTYHKTSEVQGEVASFQVLGVEHVRYQLPNIIRHDLFVYGENVQAKYMKSLQKDYSQQDSFDYKFIMKKFDFLTDDILENLISVYTQFAYPNNN